VIFFISRFASACFSLASASLHSCRAQLSAAHTTVARSQIHEDVFGKHNEPFPPTSQSSVSDLGLAHSGRLFFSTLVSFLFSIVFLRSFGSLVSCFLWFLLVIPCILQLDCWLPVLTICAQPKGSAATPAWWVAECDKLVSNLLVRPESFPYQVPVNWYVSFFFVMAHEHVVLLLHRRGLSLSDYRRHVSHPMDLGTVKVRGCADYVIIRRNRELSGHMSFPRRNWNWAPTQTRMRSPRMCAKHG
jgi:hypothetical protein